MENYIRKFLIFCFILLFFPISAFAACGDINSVGMFNFAIVVLILSTPFFLINMEYIKNSFEDAKILALNFAPLLICPALAYAQVKFFSPVALLPQQVYFGTLDKTLGLLLIYYFLFLLYGINQFYTADRSHGGDIIKFCVSIILAFSAIYGFLKVIINMSGC